MTEEQPFFSYDIELNRKQLAENLLWLDGRPFSLADYPMYDSIYKGTWRSTLMKCGRQVGKSVSAASFEVVDSVSLPFFKTLYVSPSLKQTSAFSNTRVAKILRHSPLIAKNFLNAKLPDNVFLKILNNGSELIFTYACDNPDRARGYTADRINYDEIQDILYDEVVPIINECTANSNYGYISYMGTPKTMENTIEYLWAESTQSEWCIKCEGCGSYSYFIDEKCLGKKGVICLKCSKAVNPRLGSWVDMNPIPDGVDKADPTYYRIKGFHIPQVILPLNNEDPSRWARVLGKHQEYGESEFKNEVMGVSDAIGSRLISLGELKECCEDYEVNTRPIESTMRASCNTVVGGVDWSGGGSKGYSRTVGWIWGTSGNNYTTLWYRIFPSGNPVDIVEELARVFGLYGVRLIIGDSGEGHLANSLLRKHVGAEKVLQVQYGGGEGNRPALTWNGRDRYLADRTTMIDNFLMEVKNKKMIYPKYSSIRPAFDDMLNVYEEVTSMGKKVWRHAPSCPDDALHAQIYGWLAARILNKNLEFYK